MRVRFKCPECDDELVGEAGSIGQCSGCLTWVDAPEPEDYEERIRKTLEPLLDSSKKLIEPPPALQRHPLHGLIAVTDGESISVLMDDQQPE